MKTMRDYFTLRDWERLPVGFPAQLVEGQLVKEPAPTYGHQRIAARIRHALVMLVGPDRVPDTPSDVLVDDRNVYQPDIVVLSRPADDASSYVGVPLLAVEVLSPSTQGRDRRVKTRRLLERGVQEVWLVDTRARTIEVRAAGYALHAGVGETIRSRALSGFALVVDDLHSPPQAPDDRR